MDVTEEEIKKEQDTVTQSMENEIVNLRDENKKLVAAYTQLIQLLRATALNAISAANEASSAVIQLQSTIEMNTLEQVMFRHKMRAQGKQIERNPLSVDV